MPKDDNKGKRKSSPPPSCASDGVFCGECDRCASLGHPSGLFHKAKRRAICSHVPKHVKMDENHESVLDCARLLVRAGTADARKEFKAIFSKSAYEDLSKNFYGGIDGAAPGTPGTPAKPTRSKSGSESIRNVSAALMKVKRTKSAPLGSASSAAITPKSKGSGRKGKSGKSGGGSGHGRSWPTDYSEILLPSKVGQTGDGPGSSMDEKSPVRVTDGKLNDEKVRVETVRIVDDESLAKTTTFKAPPPVPEVPLRAVNDVVKIRGLENRSLFAVVKGVYIDLLGVPEALFEIVTEEAKGGSLRDRLSRGSGVEGKEALSILKTVAEGLSIAHRENIVHGSVNIDNVLFRDKGGKVILTGFGQHVATGHIGANKVPPPECCSEGWAGPLTKEMDIWGLGVIAWEMACRAVESREDQRYPERGSPPQFPKTLESDSWSLIISVCQDCFKDRRPNVNDFLNRLSHTVNGRGRDSIIDGPTLRTRVSLVADILKGDAKTGRAKAVDAVQEEVLRVAKPLVEKAWALHDKLDTIDGVKPEQITVTNLFEVDFTCHKQVALPSSRERRGQKLLSAEKKDVTHLKRLIAYLCLGDASSQAWSEQSQLSHAQLSERLRKVEMLEAADLMGRGETDLYENLLAHPFFWTLKRCKEVLTSIRSMTESDREEWNIDEEKFEETFRTTVGPHGPEKCRDDPKKLWRWACMDDIWILSVNAAKEDYVSSLSNFFRSARNAAVHCTAKLNDKSFPKKADRDRAREHLNKLFGGPRYDGVDIVRVLLFPDRSEMADPDEMVQAKVKKTWKECSRQGKFPWFLCERSFICDLYYTALSLEPEYNF